MIIFKKKSQHSFSKMLSGILFALLAIILETSFAADVKVWNLRQDFAASTVLSTQPIIKDQNGNNTWFLKYSYDSNYPQGVFIPSTFQPMNTFVDRNSVQFAGCLNITGFEGWSLNSFLPYFVLNTTDVDITCFNEFAVPAGAVSIHPLPDAAGVVEWHSPIDGPVNIEATITDLNGGNGVAWFIGNNSTTLSSGALDNGWGNSVSLSKNVIIKKGDILYVGVGPRGEWSFDTTQIDIVVSKSNDGAPFGQGCGLTK